MKWYLYQNRLFSRVFHLLVEQGTKGAGKPKEAKAAKPKGNILEIADNTTGICN